jgi:hypothetical protein
MAAAGHADPRTINLVRYRRPMDDPAEVWRTVLTAVTQRSPRVRFTPISTSPSGVSVTH